MPCPSAPLAAGRLPLAQMLLIPSSSGFELPRSMSLCVGDTDVMRDPAATRHP